MKKKIFGSIAVLAIAAVAAFNLNLNMENKASILSLANIEVLAYGEELPSNWKVGLKIVTKIRVIGYRETWWGGIELIYEEYDDCITGSPYDACPIN